MHQAAVVILMHECIYVHVCDSMCDCMCVSVCVCACPCVHIHICYLCNFIFHILNVLSLYKFHFLIILLIKLKGIDTGIEYLNKCSH